MKHALTNPAFVLLLIAITKDIKKLLTFKTVSLQKVPLLLDEVQRLIESPNTYNLFYVVQVLVELNLAVLIYSADVLRSMFISFCHSELKELNWTRIFNQGLVPKA